MKRIKAKLNANNANYIVDYNFRESVVIMANPNPPLENLKPFKPGQSGNPAGKKPGTRSLSTIIREFLEKELDWSLVPVKPEQAKVLTEKYRGKAGWEALVAVAAGKAMSGDTKAMAWLSKAGYGDKITHAVDGGLFTSGSLKIEIIKPVSEDDRYVS